MRQFVDELQGWLTPIPAPMTAVDLSDVREALANPERDLSVQMAHRTKVAADVEEILHRASSCLEQLHKSLESLQAGTQVEKAIENFGNYLHTIVGDIPDGFAINNIKSCLLYRTYYLMNDAKTPRFYSLFGVIPREDFEKLLLVVGHAVQDTGQDGGKLHVVWKHTMSIDRGSTLTPQAVAELSQLLIANLHDASHAFVAALAAFAKRSASGL